MAQIIDGKGVAADIRREVAADVAALSSAHNLVPGLAVVIVGSRKDSQTYVQMKRKACAEVGIRSVDVDLAEDISEAALVAEVHRLNADPAVHGILVQLPLPKHINEEKILNEISLEKDVDGFHPLNIGKLAMKGRDPLFLPCTPKVPGLAVVIVGSRKDSQTYVQMKRKACAEVGIRSVDVDLAEDISEAALVAEVHRLNADPAVHGILVQLPLPKHINEEKILNEISLEKDVDGFHPLNIGKLAMKGRDPLFLPCTPKGCMELLTRSGVTINGKRAVVVGRSNIVGLPVSLLLLKADATVSIVHSRTPNPESIVREADIVIAAAGQAMMIKGDWIKPGAAVIDVGTNSISDPTRKSGYRLVGDVDFAEVSKVAGHLTPVPGGVGPMTVAMLLKNTVDGAKRGIVQ
ncbi:hypothetical protein OsJ_17144 [Oryza sativa Japonica Group]|uniref:Uncharacterized protein n=1 Tax=Oryza sativa subsp. japonica TaxID=39947 RepID=B9FHE0_ORYSJ|nr:hypothetical protein OsJ_17144 [Oryza sativa Japonica Group]